MKIHTAELGFLATNCYIVEVGNGEAVIVDPGAQGKDLVKWLSERNLIPKKILLTHIHFDHVGGVMDVLEAFPEIEVFVGPEDDLLIKDLTTHLGSSGVDEYIKNKATRIKGGDEIVENNVTFKVMESPGHSSGSVLYIAEDNMFSGDTIFREEIGRCDLTTGDYGIMLNTLKKISKLEGDFKIYSGHGPATTLEHERKHNPYMLKANE